MNAIQTGWEIRFTGRVGGRVRSAFVNATGWKMIDIIRTVMLRRRWRVRKQRDVHGTRIQMRGEILPAVCRSFIRLRDRVEGTGVGVCGVPSM